MNFLIKHFVKNYDNTSDLKVRASYGSVSGIVGIICNTVLFLLKFVIGTSIGLISVVADSFNNLSDAGSSVMSLIGFKISAMPPDKKHPFGHGRMEYICGFIISMLIFLVGFRLIESSVDEIINPASAEFEIWIAIILAASIFVKLWMFFFNLKISKKINSETIKAVAMDSISDVIITAAVIIGMAITYLTGLVLDGYIGVLIALFIIYTGFITMKETYNLLLGKAPNPLFVKKIKEKVLSFDNVIGMHDLIIHSYGHCVSMISLHLELPCNMDALYMHDTVDEIEKSLKNKFNCEVVIHMDPIVVDDEEINKVRAKVSELIQVIDDDLSMHDFRMVKGITHSKLIFEVAVPFEFRLNDEELKDKIEKAVKTIDENYTLAVNIERSFI